MPTISQLPAAGPLSAADELPISQQGSLCSTTVGTLLSSTQPAISINSPSLLGRTSVGSGSPEQIDIGSGLTLINGTLSADTVGIGSLSAASNLPAASSVVISNSGTPMLMQSTLLRGLFAAGQDITIDANGTISTTATIASSGTTASATPIAQLPTVTSLVSTDLVAVSHSGSNYAVSYSSFLDGVTIDEAQAAGAASNSDTFWVAQDSNVMASQTFSAVWVWIAGNLPTYKAPVVEITTNTNLDTTVHNGRILICSQPVTLTPLTANMGSGFQCCVVNASSGTVTLGAGFVTSTGATTLSSWQSATICCASYSGGTIAFATMPGGTTSTIATPGQPTGLASTATTSASITVSWTAPTTGGAVASYVVQYRVTGTSTWTSSSAIVGATSYLIASLAAGTSYDIVVSAQNTGGSGTASGILTVSTAAAAQATVPASVTGVTATASSSSTVLVSWTAQTGTNAATSYTVEYRVTGTTSWSSTVSGLTGTSTTVSGLLASTSYDFCVTGVNASGTGTASSVVSATTEAATASVTSITWNVMPSGTYSPGSGSLAANAHVSPSTSAIQFGVSTSNTTPPTSWTAAAYVNTDLWGQYLSVPSTAGTYYTWAEGLDGSARIVSTSTFVVT